MRTTTQLDTAAECVAAISPDGQGRTLLYRNGDKLAGQHDEVLNVTLWPFTMMEIVYSSFALVALRVSTIRPVSILILTASLGVAGRARAAIHPI